MSFTIRFTQDQVDPNSVGVYVLNVPCMLELYDMEIALSKAYLNYSWYNVTQSFNNLSFGYTWTDGNFYPVSLLQGFYLISDLNNELQLTMKANNHYTTDSNGNDVYYINFLANPNYNLVTLQCTIEPTTSKTPQLTIQNNNFGQLIGFPSGSYPPTQQTTNYVANSLNVPQISPVRVVYVTCNLASTSGINSLPNVIECFSPSVQFGSQIELKPFQMVYHPLVDGRYPSIKISFVDQNNNPLQLQDSIDVVECVVRPRKRFSHSHQNAYPY